MDSQVFVVDLGEFDADPAVDSDVGWAEVGLGVAVDESGLGSGLGGDPDRDVAALVVVVGEHAEDFLAGEEGGFAVGDLFGDVGQAEADLTDAFEMFFVHLLSCDLLTNPIVLG